MNTRRRKLLLGIGAVGTTALAGCSDDDGGNGPPDPETPTSDLLPGTDTWGVEEENDQEAGFVGGNDGVQGRYTGPDGEGYTLEILRFGEEQSAEDAVDDVYGDWLVSLAYGVFTFAVNGPSGDHARDLLAASPGLDADTVDANT